MGTLPLHIGRMQTRRTSRSRQHQASPPPVFLAVRCFSTSPLHVAPSAQASPHSGLTLACCDVGSFRCRNVKRLAARLILRFSGRMIRGDNAGSKLCAEVPRHAQVRRLSTACRRSTSQGEGQALPVASPPLCRKRHVETVPVSTPFGFRRAVRLRSWRLRP